MLDIDDRSVPTTFRGMVFADLRRAARLIVRVQDEIDPQFRIATPEGDYWLGVTLPDEPQQRLAVLNRVSLFMAWKQAPCFILASELSAPDCVYALGVSHKEVHACYSLIRREPLPWSAQNFSPVAWDDRKRIGQEMIDLLPRGGRSIDRQELTMLEQWFGADGKFPAVHIPTGELRGL